MEYGTIEDKKVILLKPQTYMNSSGESVVEFKNFYKIPEENIIVIFDDIDIEPGNIRIKRNGKPTEHIMVQNLLYICLEQINFRELELV